MNRTSEIRSLQAFVTVAREGNVSRAAEALHLTQPAVSLQLKRLAEDTGLTLFKRKAKGIELTRDGAQLLLKAERVLSALADFNKAAQRMTGQVRGKLRIGTIVDPQFIRLGQLLAGLLEDFPDIQTELSHGTSGEAINRLQRQQVDVAFYLSELLDDSGPSEAEGQAPAGVVLHKLTDFNYRIVAPPGWEVRLEGLSWQEIAALPWIGTPPESVHSRLLNRVFAQHKCTQNIVAQVDLEPSMIAMARSGVGLCLCRESIALHERQATGLSVVPHITVPVSLSIATRITEREQPVIDAFFKVLEIVWPN